MGHLDAGWSPSQPLLLQVCLHLHVSPFAQPWGVLKWIQISVPAVVCVILSDARLSLEVMFALEGRKEWRVSHALAWLAEPALAGFGEKHQMKTSSLTGPISVFCFWTLTARNDSRIPDRLLQGISAWYCSISSARLGCVTRTTPNSDSTPLAN